MLGRWVRGNISSILQNLGFVNVGYFLVITHRSFGHVTWGSKKVDVAENRGENEHLDADSAPIFEM